MSNSKALELLSKTKIEVSPEIFTLISLSHENWLKILESPELSPRMTAPFMIFRDNREITLLLDETDFTTIKHAFRDAKTEGNFRLLTFDIELSFNVVGFMAAITKILAESEISIVSLSAFSRDHILIKQTDLAKALKSLRNFVDDIC